MCKIANLKENPFTRFSAEEDIDIIEDVFYVPPFYNNLESLLEGGHSRSILGQRGQGKSVIVYKLKKDLVRRGCLPLLIDRYDGIPLTDNIQHFLYKITQTITLGLAQKVIDKTLCIKDIDKTLLSKFYVLVEMFYDTQWADDFMESIKTIQNKKRLNFLKRIVNKYFCNLINEGLDYSVQITGELIRNTIIGKSSVKSYNYDETRKKLFTGFEISEFKTLGIHDANKIEVDEYIRIIKILLAIIERTHIKSIVVMFDKIDEVHFLNSDVKNVALFMEGILTDNNLLYTPKLGIVFTLWTDVKRSLNNLGVRFDKFPTIDIRWENHDLESIINKRLFYYSINKECPVTLGSLIPEDITKNAVITLADGSPRSLLKLLCTINGYDGREHITAFSPEAMTKGMVKFCKDFDFVSLCSYKNNTNKKDITDWINKLLSIRKNSFVVTEYMNTANVKKPTANKHIEQLLRFELIKKESIPTQEGEDIYKVYDPRIIHLMSRGIMTLD